MLLAPVFKALVAIFLIAFNFPSALSQPLQPIPALTARAIDQTATLSAAELAALESRLSTFERESGAQVVVLMVTTTAPEDIAAYANRVANDWKIGRKGVGDGLLLIVAKQDRKLRIEVAKSLEGAIPDLAARQIIDGAITPPFKQGHYAVGIDAGLGQIFARIRGEALPEPEHAQSAGNGKGFDWMDLGIFLFFAVPVGAPIARATMGRTLGTLAVGAGTGLLAYLVTASLGVAIAAAFAAMLWGLIARGSGGLGGGGGGWGGGSGSSSSGGDSSGGGFSSGGGGDFGGGGASGDW